MSSDTAGFTDIDYQDYRASFLLLEFKGRIGRMQFWWGMVLLALLNIGLTIGLAMLFGVDMPSYLAGSRTASVVDFIVLAGLVFPTMALLTKRLNDRDMGPWLGILFYILVFLISIELYFKVPEKLRELDFIALVPLAMTIGVLGWLLLECGLMPAFDSQEDERE